MNNFSNMDDLIDSRDIIARIEHLSQLREPGPVDLGADDGNDQDELFAELAMLEALAEEGEDYAPDWSYGETLVRDSYFQTYAYDLAVDVGAIDDNAKWPNTCIDWEQAARELRYDYTSIDFGGVTYWIR